MSGSGSGEESARGRKLREVLDKMFQFYEKDMLRQDAINPLVEALGEERTIELLERFLEDLRGKAHVGGIVHFHLPLASKPYHSFASSFRLNWIKWPKTCHWKLN